MRINRPRLRFDLRRLVGMRIGRTLVRPVEQGSNPPLSHSCDATGRSRHLLGMGANFASDTTTTAGFRAAAREGPSHRNWRRHQMDDNRRPLFMHSDKTSARLCLQRRVIPTLQQRQRNAQAFHLFSGRRCRNATGSWRVIWRVCRRECWISPPSRKVRWFSRSIFGQGKQMTGNRGCKCRDDGRPFPLAWDKTIG